MEDYFKYGIFTLLFLTFAGGYLYQLFVPIPEANRESLLGDKEVLKAVVYGVLGFYFGSSLSARKNRDTLNNIAEKTADTLTDVIKK